MTEVEKFYHCRLVGLFEVMMINMGHQFVGKRTAPVYIDLNLPSERSRSFKTKNQLDALNAKSEDVFADGKLEKY